MGSAIQMGSTPRAQSPNTAEPEDFITQMQRAYKLGGQAPARKGRSSFFKQPTTASLLRPPPSGGGTGGSTLGG